MPFFSFCVPSNMWCPAWASSGIGRAQSHICVTLRALPSVREQAASGSGCVTRARLSFLLSCLPPSFFFLPFSFFSSLFLFLLLCFCYSPFLQVLLCAPSSSVRQIVRFGVCMKPTFQPFSPSLQGKRWDRGFIIDNICNLAPSHEIC